MTNPLALLAVASLLSLAACTAQTASPAATTSPLVECTARYQCVSPDGHIRQSALERAESGLCEFRGRLLFEDGRVTDLLQNDAGTWTWTATSLEVCEKAGCHQCQRVDPSSPDAECTGSPSYCSSRSPGSCSSIRGCYMRTRVRYNGTYDNYCDGTPYSCESMGSESSCREQGCDWQ